MKIDNLNTEQKQTAVEIIIDELNRVGIKLDVNNSADRHKAMILASNLRIEFNEIGGLK